MMAYADGQDLTAWSYIRQIYDLLETRTQMLGVRRFPNWHLFSSLPEWDQSLNVVSGTTVWDGSQATIQSATNSTIVGNDWLCVGNWGGAPSWPPVLNDNALPGRSGTLCLAIDNADIAISQHLQAIGGVPGTLGSHTWNTTAVADWLALNWITSGASLVGQKYRIIQTWPGASWSKRWPTAPLPTRTTVSTSLVGNGTTATVTYTPFARPAGDIDVNQLNSARSVTISGVMPADFNGTYTITQTGNTTFTFPCTFVGTATAQGAIKLHGILGDPMALWYGGMREAHWTHRADSPRTSWGTGGGPFQQVQMPVDSYRIYQSYPGGGGGYQTYTAFDWDTLYSGFSAADAYNCNSPGLL